MIRPRLIIVIVIIAIFIWTLFAPPQSLSHFRMKLANTARLPLKVITGSFNHIITISQLSYVDREKLELRHRVRELEKERTESEEARLENNRLRNLLGFKQSFAMSTIAASVIGRDPNSWSSVVFIDKGSDDGIREGSVAISSDGLAGRVRESGRTMSKVMLINDVDSKIGAIVQRSREQGLLVGTAEGECRLIYLSLDADIAIGDKILTSSIGMIYPKGMLIGEVKRVATERGRLYKYAVVEPSVNISILEDVLCIK